MNTSHTFSNEFLAARLGDPRRVARLVRIAEQFAVAPDASLPDRAGDPSQLEGTYRFLNNEHVTPEAVLEPHQACTVRRAREAGRVLVMHDTTEFCFGGDARRGLGWLGGNSKPGFYAHMSLCVGVDGRPLGLLGLYAWVRTGDRRGRRSPQESQYDPTRESLRWPESVQRCEELLGGAATAIHVMDREGDFYESLAEMVEHGYRFVVRLAHDRRLDTNREAVGVPKLHAALHEAPIRLKREVPLTRRKHPREKPTRQREAYPERDSRMASLEIRVLPAEISMAKGGALHLRGGLKLNFVEVSEPNPPPDQSPVLWRLATTEPAETAEQVAAVVDAYRQRWLIEEYFKALKTGCRYEELQLETGRALLVALPIYAAVAWRMLLMRWLDRKAPDAPATNVLTRAQLAILLAMRRRTNKPLPENPTTHDVLLAIARFGGHLTQNGPPGWLVIGRGMAKLLEMETGWLEALGAKGIGDPINP